MVANETLEADIKRAVRAELAVQAGIPEEQILVQLRKGSIIVLASFLDVNQAQQGSGLTRNINDRAWQQIVEDQVALRVQGLAAEGSIATGGPIVVSFRSVVTPPTPTPTPSTPAPKPPNALPGELWEDEAPVAGARRVAGLSPLLLLGGGLWSVLLA